MRLLNFFICLITFSGYGQDAREIVRIADEKMRGKTLVAEVSIQTIRPSWSREMRVKTWLKGNQLSIILIEAPAKDRGIAFLRRSKEVWNWLPSLERTIKLPPSMMSQSWMGTDFTNDDLVKESSILSDYDHRLLGDTTVRGRDCYKIEMIPRPEAAVVWGRLLAGIDKKDHLELFVIFYDEEGLPVNIMEGYEEKIMDGRLIPTRFEMIPADKKGRKTIMKYLKVEYDRPLADNLFSLEKIKTLQ
jgi:hypothetical protein